MTGLVTRTFTGGVRATTRRLSAVHALSCGQLEVAGEEDHGVADEGHEAAAHVQCAYAYAYASHTMCSANGCSATMS
ncbi:hypothetical protein ADL03_40005 [Nocardia sp. NRRL S-836]|nr:hypothetical protein ADL03_40005 [Nocardia sp. NRRL S-836]